MAESSFFLPSLCLSCCRLGKAKATSSEPMPGGQLESIFRDVFSWTAKNCSTRSSAPTERGRRPTLTNAALLLGSEGFGRQVAENKLDVQDPYLSAEDQCSNLCITNSAAAERPSSWTLG